MPTAFWTASQLRRDLSHRAAHLARTHGLLHDVSTGASPTVLFGRDEHGRHGNFHPASYDRICANPDWLHRLAKVHTASRRSRARHDWQWMELDSASSSDALLMNIFCHPEVFDGAHLSAPVATLLGIDRATTPCFGTHPGVPLHTPLKSRTKNSAPREALDRTEIDLTLTDPTASLFVEAKLTESDFQLASPRLIQRYRDLETVFDIARLPHPHIRVPHSSQHYRDGWGTNSASHLSPDLDDSFLNLPSHPIRISGYQLIRNVLAAFAADASFCVLCDARRHDLIETWYKVLSAVHASTFTHRLKLLTWQELAATLPLDLQQFLATKYGITP